MRAAPYFRILFAVSFFDSSTPEPLSSHPFDLVEAALLVPPDVPIRGGSRPDAAVVVDRELVKLAGVEAHARIIQAHLVARMMAIRGWQSLGFVRLSDYARERLGLASRTLEEDALVVRLLSSLPLLCAALESQSLPWTKVRMLVHSATPASEEELLAVTAGMTTRKLERFLKDRAADSGQGAEASTTEDAKASSDASADVASSETSGAAANDVGVSPEASNEEMRWDISLSRSGRRLWTAVTELAQRCAGTPLSQADVLELVCAEAISGRPTSSTEKRWIPEADIIQARLLRRYGRCGLTADRSIEAFRAWTGVVEGFPWLGAAAATPGPARTLDRLLDGVAAAPRAEIPATTLKGINPNIRDRSHATTVLNNVNTSASLFAGSLNGPREVWAGVDAFELDRRLREVRLAVQRVDAQMASLLRVGADRRLFRELGFATVKLYVESRLGISSRKAWSLIAIERASWRCCMSLREAWKLGRISHLAASTLLPVISERHGNAWVQRATEVTLRRLHDEVVWALDHGDRHPALDPPAPPPAGTNVRADTAGDVSIEEVQMRAHDPAQPDVSMGPPGALRLTFRLPLAVAVLVETTLWLLARDTEPQWRTFERMVAQAILEWSSQPRHRDPIFERDGWRCAVPACSSRRNLHDHHVIFRSKGGDNSRDNRVTVCASHHLHGIHQGRVRAHGRAPEDVVWELGCRRGERPLMRLRGDWVVGREFDRP